MAWALLRSCVEILLGSAILREFAGCRTLADAARRLLSADAIRQLGMLLAAFVFAAGCLDALRVIISGIGRS